MDDEDEERLGSDEEGSRSTWSLSLSLASSKRTRRVLDDELEEDVEDWKGARSKKQEARESQQAAGDMETLNTFTERSLLLTLESLLRTPAELIDAICCCWRVWRCSISYREAKER